ncbi:hypothetical protein H310_09909 [Aphanomyces invadans]|uniref:Uncharacterized protein n=1 Tax=Aphanomyces invadans TaxID=157072 RepID=A0A024TUS2_9STRA|nr:hypothetical protein H310_09909 [Aphanomyces invadans]ETV97092.1 hypothetical protein H310_09909 [Aphanomyces invadans]|eukprot:XP_008874338.1 hypothetical protein H310_09909 [Aphanomyces invadans]
MIGVAVDGRRVGTARTGVLVNDDVDSGSREGSVEIEDFASAGAGVFSSGVGKADANENDLICFHVRDTMRRFCGELCTVLKYFGGRFAATTSTDDVVGGWVAVVKLECTFSTLIALSALAPDLGDATGENGPYS